MADVDTELAIDCVAGLICQDLVRLVDIFQYSNIYASTKDVGRIASDTDLREKCLATILDPAVRKTMTTNELFSLYAALRPGLRYEDFCLTRESKLIGTWLVVLIVSTSRNTLSISLSHFFVSRSP
mmetsp:Transcript_22745/g.91110  ORF Transcript_22745/g.91110 Transcript_22745/m.91110 type:complete len:126 (+) Transcript_22745:854-1231(+)